MNPSSSSLTFSSSSKGKRDPGSFDLEPCFKMPKNDVFINYSFKDMGKSFVSHLKRYLKRYGYSISDNTMLPKGRDVCFELLKAIEESEIYLVVFSINYAFSMECLDELVFIMESLYNLKKRKVLPIFFNVHPYHVRSQHGGSFMQAFQEHETNIHPERVQKWRQALNGAGQLSGLIFRDGDEGQFLGEIVKFLGNMKNPLELFDATNPVGIEPRSLDIILNLRLSDNCFAILAVVGIGGSGKTTIVKAVYDKIAADFDATCFIENIRDYGHRGQNWKADLQNDVLSCLSGNDQGYNVGAAKIRKLISSRKVLMVLDDVDNVEQLQAIGIHHAASFGCGSRIIVTTRNKQSLGTLPYTPYEISLLTKRESFELFTRLAFGKDDPVDKKFVDEIVFLAAGLPLVLEVWGHHFKSHERKQWSSLLKTLKIIPHEDIQKKLQISYDSLTKRAKKLFLDITCFFYMMEKDLVVKVLQDEDLAFFPDNEIQYLVDKSLVKIDRLNKISMHHAIKEMGEEVVRREYEDEPGQRLRLMGDKDVVRVLRDCSGTESIESIILGYNEMKERENVQIEAFKQMSNLRFIKLIDSHLQWSSSSDNDDIFSFSFKKLKYFEWKMFPCKYLGIDMENVVVIKLQHSNLETLWDGCKSLKKLRILDVSYSISLTKSGNFSGLDNLENLRLIGCEKLEELHSSIGCLEKLVELDLSNCTQLKRFPWEMIGKLTSLLELKLENCSNILNTLSEVGSLSDSLRQLHELKMIDLYGCAKLKSIPNLSPNIKCIEARNCISLVNLPSNMSELQFLGTLELNGCLKLEPEGLMKVTGLRNLKILRMRNCNVSEVSSKIGNMVSLRTLDLSENTFSSLPDSFRNLSKLVNLKLNKCSELELLPLLPSNLKVIEASGCWSLDVMPYEDSMQTTYIFRSKMFEESFFTKDKELWICLSGDEVPDWCSYTSNGDVLSFVVPLHLDKKICGVIICPTFSKELDDGSGQYLSPTMLNKTKEISHRFSGLIFCRCSMCLMFFQLNDTTLMVEAGDSVILQFANHDVLSCGLRLIYEGDLLDDSTLLIQKSNVFEPTLPVPLEMATQDGKIFATVSEEYEYDFDDDDDDDDDDDNHLDEEVLSSLCEDGTNDNDNVDSDDEVFYSPCEDNEYDSADGDDEVYP